MPLEIPSMRPETRYGLPAADLLLFNRSYVIGYSNLFRQPRYALELIDPLNSAVEVDRIDSFRVDHRVDEKFRSDLADYSGTGYDRGHLVCSADRRARDIHNSETFLLSNMSPQAPELNRGMWKTLEESIRTMSADMAEVYVICGPIFDVGRPIETVGPVPVPHAFFKSVLAESVSGSLKVYSFILPNSECQQDLPDYLVRTGEVEARTGLDLWDRLKGSSGERLTKGSLSLW